MQRQIDSYFTKKGGPKPKDATPVKRKAIALSSDEEGNQTAQVATPSKKKQRLSKKSIQTDKKNDADLKNVKHVDVSDLFGGDVSRTSTKRKKSPVPEAKHDTITEETTHRSPRPSKPPTSDGSTSGLRRSSRTPKKSPKHAEKEESTSKRHSPRKFKLSDVVFDEPKKAKRSKESEAKVEEAKTPKSELLKKSSSEEPQSKEKKQKPKQDLETSVLSDEEKFERRRLGYQIFKCRPAVINPGSKEIPKGTPNCLSGLSFLVTGVLEAMEREEAHDLIAELGGKVVKSVGKRLNYVIAGEESGPKKLADAESLGITILSLDQFFDLIRGKSKNPESHSKEKLKKFSNEKTPTKRKLETKQEHSAEVKRGHASGHVSVKHVKREKTESDIGANTNGIIAKKDSSAKQEPQIHIKKEKSDDSKVKTEKTEENISKVDQKSTSNVDESSLAWVEKYKPTSVKQIVGQQGPSSNCAKLTNWLTKWHTNHNGTKKLQRPSPWAKNDDGSYFKAVLLSGPPGVGKTTTATLVCKELGFDTVEFNASDTRSKRLLKDEISALLSNKSLFGYFHGNESVVSKKHVLIMDEVDGMAGNEDRGGIQELIALIKDTHVPIICMCNDRNHQKMRSLVNYCYDLRFNRPRAEQIKGFVRSMCFKEKLKISPEKIDEIIQATNNDIRQTINHICMLGSGQQVDLTMDSGKTAQKDMKIGPWEVIRKVFSADEHKNMSFADKSDLFFHDYSMAPLFVQQNYLIVSPAGPRSEVLSKVALTADALSLGDLVDKRIRSNSAWSLLPVQAMFSSVLPGEYMEGRITAQINFPGWLGKNSKSNKRSRLAQEIYDHTRIRTSASRLSIRLDYAPFLLASIVRPLRELGQDGVEESLKVIQEYRLLREDIDSLVELSIWPGMKSPLDTVDGRVKAALTRQYNKEVLPYTYSANATIKRKKQETTDDLDMMATTENGDGGVDAQSEEENDDNLENDCLIKSKKKENVTAKSSTSKGTAGKKTSTSTKPKGATKSKK